MSYTATCLLPAGAVLLASSSLCSQVNLPTPSFMTRERRQLGFHERRFVLEKAIGGEGCEDFSSWH